LMMSVAMGARDEDTLTSLANRLIRLDKVMTDKEKSGFKKICGGQCIEIAKNLLDAFDEDIVCKTAQKQFGIADTVDVTDEQHQEMSRQMADAAAKHFNNPNLRNYIEDIRKKYDQIIDNTNIDTVTFTGWDLEHAEKARDAIKTFARFIEENKNTVDALEIIYSQSYRNRPLTLQMIKDMHESLQQPSYRLTTEILWKAYSVIHPDKVWNKNPVVQLADIISLIRFQLGQTPEINSFSNDVNLRFRDWIFAKNEGHKQFSEEQTEWLRMIRDHITTSMSIAPEDFDYSPFNGKGGLGKFYQLFGNEYETILSEMNHALLEAA